jgi:phosphatidylserine synthase 2
MLMFLDDTDSVPGQLYHRILIRPHPAVWRLVHGLAVVYLVALTFLLFQVSATCGFQLDTILLSFLAFSSNVGSYLLLIYQNRDDARQFMKHLHPDLGVGKISVLHIFTRNVIFFKKMVVVVNFYLPNAELPERSYGADCRLYVPENPKNKFINIYV